MYIMLENKPVLYFDFDEHIVEVIESRLLPIALRDRILSVPVSSVSDILKVMFANTDALSDWMSNRVLSLSRDNAKQIFNMFNISQSNDRKTRVKICLLCHGVSITDSYWIKTDNDDTTWEQINVRKNHFKEIVDIALDGDNPSITTNSICPELTTKGLFKKAWFRDPVSKELYLLKSDRHSENINTHMEVLASHVLDCFTNVSHVQYSGRVRNTATGKMYVDKCKNFVTETYSFVEARDVMSFCKLHEIDFRTWALETFGSKFANIAVVDYIIMNTDRHDNNYGFMMDNQTGELVDVAPLFDYNLALISDAFGTNAKDTLSQMFNTHETIIELASKMFRHSNVEIDYEHLNHIKKHFADYPQVYTNVIQRIESLSSIADNYPSYNDSKLDRRDYVIEVLQGEGLV